jgi:hypothetical protein
MSTNSSRTTNHSLTTNSGHTTNSSLTTNSGTARRSALGTTAVVAVGVALAAFVVSVIGRLAGLKGFSNSDADRSTFSDVNFFAFVLGVILALALGTAAWVLGRRSGRLGDAQAGKAALAGVVLAIVAASLFAVVSG